jgi:hypothetical protein
MVLDRNRSAFKILTVHTNRVVNSSSVKERTVKIHAETVRDLPDATVVISEKVKRFFLRTM